MLLLLENLPSLEQTIDSGSDVDDFEDEFEDNFEEEESVKCLFCEKVLNGFQSVLKHLEVSHDFNLQSIHDKFQMDQYSFIKVSSKFSPNNTDSLNTKQFRWSTIFE